MCKAFSALITKRDKVYWKMGIDSHEDLREEFKKDKDLEDHRDPPHNTFARIEIHPKNGNYVTPDTWVYFIDEKIRPEWLSKKHEKLAWKEQKKWWKNLNDIVDFKSLRNIKNPLTDIKPPKTIVQKHLRLVKKIVVVRDSVGASVWDSVGDSVGDSVWDSVGDSVGDSVWDSVGASVWDSVGDSVGDSVWANIGFSFKGIKKWKYIDNLHEKGYPFLAEVKLWRLGLVLSYDSYNKWRLHGGPKAKIMWEGTDEDIKKI